ncbi:MAG: oligosaccharide flippase family protein [Muribaculum sp.]|nr:oligosaccharide flippase family protein [Muribaculum sp.]
MTEHNSSTEKAIKGVYSQTAIVLMKSVLSLLYFSLMSRLLTPEDFGYFALITAVTTILCSLSEAGLGSSVVQKKDADKDYTSTAFTMSLALGTFFSFILVCGAEVFSKIVSGSLILTNAFRIMSIILILQAINNIAWAMFMRNLDFFKYGLLQIVSDTISYIVGISLAYNGYGFYSIVGAVVCNHLSLTIILLSLGKLNFRIKIIKSYVHQIIEYGGWLTGAVIVRNFTNEISKVIIGRLLPITDLGAINRPQGFVDRISGQVNGIFDTVLFPILSDIQDNPDKVSRAYIKIVTISTTFAIMLGGTMALGSNIIIEIFFGSQWLYLEPILVIFSLAVMIHGYSRIADSFFRSLGIVKKYFWTRVINWVVLILLVCLGCEFGILGATIGIVSGSLISCIIKYFMQKDAVGVKPETLFYKMMRNVLLPIILFTSLILLKHYCNMSDYIAVILFVISIIISILIFPGLYGNEFREVVINRYFKRFEKYRIF